MTLSSHTALLPLIVLSALLGFGWMLIVYILSFRAAQWVVDRIEPAPAPVRRMPPRRHVMR